MGELRCAVDGVKVAKSRAGRLVHTDALPKGIDPEHEIDPVTDLAYTSGNERRLSLRQAAHDMLGHHAALHPESSCEFAVRLAGALRA